MTVSAALPAQFEPPQPVTVNISEALGCAAARIGARVDGRISGQLLDEGGEPLPGVDVQLADAANARAVKWPLRTINAKTDENGRFEFRYVGPGRYVVAIDLDKPLRPGWLNKRRFYPGTLDPLTATEIRLETAERRQLSPFRLPPLPADVPADVPADIPANVPADR